jgi:head-tail adaptor
MLSDRDLAEMEAAAEAALPSWCSISRGTEVNDHGDVSKTWRIVATTRCRVDVTYGSDDLSERPYAERVADVMTFYVTMPASVDVTSRDRIMVGARILEVVGVDDAQSWQITKRAVVIEVAV